VNAKCVECGALTVFECAGCDNALCQDCRDENGECGDCEHDREDDDDEDDGDD
jgi:hypothetical protein